jgi:membrane-associated phospholipid phosphatase
LRWADPAPIFGDRMDSPVVHPPGVGWLRLAATRLRTLLLAKTVGITVAMAAFFTAYFWLLNHARQPVTTVPRIFIDRMIGFEPRAVVLYASLWPYVTLAPALLTSRRELASYAWAAVAMSIVGFGTFILWPTAVPRPDFDVALHPSLATLKAVDASGNAFPSLHVAFAVFSAAWLGRLLRAMGAGVLARAANWIWCLGIVYSTLAIRQHVALDAVSGALLGAAVAAAHFRALGPMRA